MIDLASRRVQIVGSMPRPDERFLRQVGCTLAAADVGVLVDHLVLICDRDAIWSAPVCERATSNGLRGVNGLRRTVYSTAPTRSVHTWRCVRAIQEIAGHMDSGRRIRATPGVSRRSMARYGCAITLGCAEVLETCWRRELANTPISSSCRELRG